MKKILLKSICLVLIVITSFSCKKKKSDPIIQKIQCPILSVDGPTGNLRNFEWVGNKLVRVYSKDSIPTTMVFRYNNKNLAESMEVSTSNSGEKYTINFIYSDKNIIEKSLVNLNGLQFMTNEFSYNENQTLTSVKTIVELFGRKSTGKTRIVYDKGNVSKVYSAIDNDIETLAFTGDLYDDKLQYFPEVYKIAALGFVGIANNFFSFFGTNNMVKGKVYDGKGRIDQETKIEYIYTGNGLPLQSESTSIRNGIKKTMISSYSFGCK